MNETKKLIEKIENTWIENGGLNKDGFPNEFIFEKLDGSYQIGDSITSGAVYTMLNYYMLKGEKEKAFQIEKLWKEKGGLTKKGLPIKELSKEYVDKNENYETVTSFDFYQMLNYYILKGKKTKLLNRNWQFEEEVFNKKILLPLESVQITKPNEELFFQKWNKRIDTDAVYSMISYLYKIGKKSEAKKIEYEWKKFGGQKNNSLFNIFKILNKKEVSIFNKDGFPQQGIIYNKSYAKKNFFTEKIDKRKFKISSLDKNIFPSTAFFSMLNYQVLKGKKHKAIKLEHLWRKKGGFNEDGLPTNTLERINGKECDKLGEYISATSVYLYLQYQILKNK